MPTTIHQGWLPAAPFRSRFRSLLDTTGLGWRELSLAMDLPAPLARRLAQPLPLSARDRIRVEDARLILSASVDEIRARMRDDLPGAPSAHRLRRLMSRGLSMTAIQEATGLPRAVLVALEVQHRPRTTRRVALGLQALEEELDHIPGLAPSRVQGRTSA